MWQLNLESLWDLEAEMESNTEQRLKLLEQEVLQLRERVLVLEKRTPKGNVILSGTSKYVRDYITEKKREVDKE